MIVSGSLVEDGEAPTHANELTRRRVIVHRSPENFIELDKGKFALFTGEGLVNIFDVWNMYLDGRFHKKLIFLIQYKLW